MHDKRGSETRRRNRVIFFFFKQKGGEIKLETQKKKWRFASRGGRAVIVQSPPLDFPRPLQTVLLKITAIDAAPPPHGEEPESLRASSAPNNSSGDIICFFRSFIFFQFYFEF